MFEKYAALMAGFAAIEIDSEPITVYESAEHAIDDGKCPAIVLDFATYTSIPYSEDGSIRSETPSYMLALFVPHNEADMSDNRTRAQELYLKSYEVILSVCPSATIYGEPIGPQSFGGGQAYCVAYLLQLTEEIRY
jgi:hypothetical protein